MLMGWAGHRVALEESVSKTLQRPNKLRSSRQAGTSVTPQSSIRVVKSAPSIFRDGLQEPHPVRSICLVSPTGLCQTHTQCDIVEPVELRTRLLWFSSDVLSTQIVLTILCIRRATPQLKLR